MYKKCLIFIFFSACDCNPDGSYVEKGCDDDGKCYCKTDLIVGDACDDCKDPYKGQGFFPNCPSRGPSDTPLGWMRTSINLMNLGKNLSGHVDTYLVDIK